MKSKRHCELRLRAELLFTLLWGLSWFPAATQAQSAGEIYASAGEAYKNMQYRDAAASYEQLLAQGYRIAEVYYNLANCYFKTDSIARSILNYERALRLSPDDEDAAHNLRLAQQRTIDRIEPVPRPSLIIKWNRFLESASTDGWGTFALIALWAAFATAAVGLFSGARRILFSLAGILFFASVFFLMLSTLQARRNASDASGIIMSASVNVKSAPDGSAGNIFLLHEGTKVQVVDRVGDWNKIRLADGKIGWIERTAVEKI
jgi:tetratricopeptide (TPR) repeat protein